MTVSYDRHDGDYHRARFTVKRDRRFETWRRRLWRVFVMLAGTVLWLAVIIPHARG